ncbi:MAG TPA: hypothetical protein VFK45_00635 [Gammaproteobacteria bacterium]|nr:hypothetical protein [Gammaproteobacteria bacterium]
MSKKKKPLPLMVGAAITGTSILIAMGGVAFLTYGLYRGLIAAFGLAPWASALATGGGAFIGAGLFVAIVGSYSRWKHSLHHKVEHYKDPQTYVDRIETEIDTRLDSDVSRTIFANPKGAVVLGLAVGVAAGASKDLRRLLIQVGQQFRS